MTKAQRQQQQALFNEQKRKDIDKVRRAARREGRGREADGRGRSMASRSFTRSGTPTTSTSTATSSSPKLSVPSGSPHRPEELKGVSDS